jgi:KaiC/GvpD/RAD55 family RecA-like ATPase
MSDDFSTEMQKLFLEFLQSDPDLFVKCNTITQIDFFEHKFRPVIKFMKEYHDEYSGIPTISQISAKTGVSLSNITDIQENERNWFLDEYETFCRYKALEKAILASTDKLEKKEYGAVEQLIKQAVSIGLTKDLGMDYWNDPKKRLEDIKETKPAISTGWKTIDTVLYGGFERGTLNVFAAPSGHGKSLMLQNIALNWALTGYNVVYISLELSTKLCSMRLDSMLTGYGTRDLFKNIDDVSLKLSMISKNAANLQIVQLPNGININDLKAYVKEYSTKKGIMVDAVVVDYLDLMTPAQKKVPLNDVFTKDKFVSEELRNFTIEGNYLFATASQIGRGGIDEAEFGMQNIAGGISKIYTADNVIGLHASKAMKERGKIQIEFMKTRSSAGEGRKLELSYDNTCMRIKDIDDEDNNNTSQSTQPSIYDKLKAKSSNNDAPEPKSDSNIDINKLKSILKRRD